jgi:hypothetical protein
MSHRLCKTALIALPVAIMTTITGCQPQKKLIDETAAHYNPSDIRKLVAPLFPKYSYTGIGGLVVSNSDMPKGIRALPLFSESPDLIETFWATSNGDGLAFLNGSGFGHWGIVVCRKESSREFDGWPGYKYWGDGIYFYNGH